MFLIPLLIIALILGAFYFDDVLGNVNLSIPGQDTGFDIRSILGPEREQGTPIEQLNNPEQPQ